MALLAASPVVTATAPTTPTPTATLLASSSAAVDGDGDDDRGAYGGDDAGQSLLLPPGWEIRRSQRTGLPFFVNLLTMEASYTRPTSAADDPDRPLPPGWEIAFSRSTGAPYYFHEQSGESMYTHPSSIARLDGATTPPPPRER